MKPFPKSVHPKKQLRYFSALDTKRYYSQTDNNNNSSFVYDGYAMIKQKGCAKKERSNKATQGNRWAGRYVCEGKIIVVNKRCFYDTAMGHLT